ncbi:MAG: ATPase, T2SS/T4P/T4SS family [Planctomycetaceae bacterium]|nr:ATPase, T2SS/T4P/T4SS family [Planctomycetaceae bacterium]
MARYYIRNRGKRMGPLDVEKLHAMARRGRFGRHFEVSRDGKRWAQADEFPELFPDAGDDDGFDDEDDFDEPAADDLDAPIVDEDTPRRRSKKKSAGRRRTRSSTGGSRSPRRRSEEPADDAETERPRRKKRRPDPDEEAPERIEPERPRKKKKKKGASVFAEASRSAPRKKPKKKGLLGRLFGGGSEPTEVQPHLRKLTHIHNTLRDLGFSMDRLVFVGSGGEKISVGEHLGSGDGPHMLGLITLVGFQSRTTDMHFEPADEHVDVRMRIDGTLVPLCKIPKDSVKRLYGVVKVLCETKMGASQEVLEGNYSSIAPNRRSDYRVSFTPSVHGQKLAIRVLDADNAPQTLRQLGAPPKFVKVIGNVMEQNAGMVLMCGPTGSGKTTTLYSMLRSVDFRSRNVMTLEDPVEYQIDGITQINIDSEHGKGFGEMLPALLRQDPDVLLIGEIRDAISAKIAMQATMTGHLVLSTVHAPDTLATLHRLLDLNADPNMVASALDLIMSQRLLRTLCEECKHRRRPDKEEKRRLGKHFKDAVYDPVGCKQCLGTGYSGRRAIFELLDVKRQVGDVIHDSPNVVQLRKQVKDTDFTTLRMNGHSLIGKGVTTFDEVDRGIGVE